MSAAPDRGDVIWVALDPVAGREQAGRRPVLVVSPVAYNARTGRAVCLPITSRERGFPFDAPLPEGLPVSGVVQSDQVRSIDWRARGAGHAGRLPDAVVADAVARLGALLFPPPAPRQTPSSARVRT